MPAPRSSQCAPGARSPPAPSSRGSDMGSDSAGLTDVIAAPADKIIDALTDFETFPEWQGAVLECEVLERDDDGRGSLVRMKVDAKVRKVEYIVRYAYD